MNYYLSRNYREEGPYSLPHILAMHGEGLLEGEYYARAVGSNAWVPLAEVLATRPPARRLKLTPRPKPRPEPLPAWKPVGGLGKALMLLLFLFVLRAAETLLNCLTAQSILVQARQGSLPAVEAVWQLEKALNTPDVLRVSFIQLSLVLVIVACIWFYNVAVNARIMSAAAGRSAFSVNPALFVGSFFLPGYNLFKPYKDMKRIYNETLRPEKSNDAVWSGTVAFWWASFLAAYSEWLPISIAESSFPEARSLAVTLDYFDFTYRAKIASSLVDLVAAVGFFVLVRRVTKGQEKAQEMAASTSP